MSTTLNLQQLQKNGYALRICLDSALQELGNAYILNDEEEIKEITESLKEISQEIRENDTLEESVNNTPLEHPLDHIRNLLKINIDLANELHWFLRSKTYCENPLTQTEILEMNQDELQDASSQMIETNNN